MHFKKIIINLERRLKSENEWKKKLLSCHNTIMHSVSTTNIKSGKDKSLDSNKIIDLVIN